MRRVYLVFIAFLLVSCSKTNIQTKALQYPNWYINPPQNTNNSLYGVAMGFSHDEAVKKALENLSSRLLVTISANTTISSKSYRNYREYTQKTITEDIKSQIESLSLQNFTIENSSIFDGKIIVLVSVQKDVLKNGLKKEIDFLYKEFELLKKQNIDFLTLYLRYKDLLQDFYKNYNKAQILASFINDNDKYIKTIDELKNIENSLKNKINFFISYDDNSKKFDILFKDSLVKKGFKVIKTKEQNSNSYELNLSSITSENKAYDFYIIENILNIKIKDSKNIQLLGKTIELKGASSNGFEDAKLNLIQKLKQNKETIDILPF